MYALVQNGVVIELYTPPAGYTIAQCFPASLASQFIAVPSGVTPSQGWLYSNGTFSAPPAASPSAISAYGNFIAGGLNITFPDSPALTGTYAIDSSAQQKITSVSVYINLYNKFPNGGNQVWPLLNNTTVTFDNILDFQAFAQTVTEIVAQADVNLTLNDLTMPNSIITLPVIYGSPAVATPQEAGAVTQTDDASGAPISPAPQAAGTATD